MVSLVVLISVFLLASCGASPSAPTVVPTHHSAATPVPSTQATTTPGLTPTSSPGVVLGPQACPVGVADPAYWLPIIKPYSYGGPLTVERVSCASMMGTSSLQTLVKARQHHEAHAHLDLSIERTRQGGGFDQRVQYGDDGAGRPTLHH